MRKITLTYIDNLYIMTVVYIDYLYIKKGEVTMPIDKALISGSTSMLLMRLLEDKDMYGYEMIETLQKRSNNVFMLKAGTLYPLLHSLEEKNYLTSYESEANGKQRKYYSITKEGRNYLKSRKEEWQEYQTAVLNVLWEVFA